MRGGKACSFLKVRDSSSARHHVQGFKVSLEEDGGIVCGLCTPGDETGGMSVKAL
ncbi:MAG: hypothetical protein ABSA72_11200 [Nitrososphaerales archaeon]